MDETLIEDLQKLDPTDTLPVDVDQVRNHARLQDLIAYPGFPVLNHEDSAVRAAGLTAEDFLAIASGVGCRLVYVDAEYFHAEDAHLEDWSSSQQARLRKITAQFDGQLVSINLYFRHDGVWHRWTEESVAMTLLWELTDTGVTASFDTGGVVRTAIAAERTGIYAEDIDAEKFDELVQLIVASPEYRESRQQMRYHVVREHPALKKYVEAGGDVDWRVNVAAAQVVEKMQREANQRLMTKRGELANELCTTPEWSDARTTELRREVTRDFLKEHSGGFTMSRALREEVLKLAREAERSRLL